MSAKYDAATIALRDWVDANGIDIQGATPSMLAQVVIDAYDPTLPGAVVVAVHHQRIWVKVEFADGSSSTWPFYGPTLESSLHEAQRNVAALRAIIAAAPTASDADIAALVEHDL